VRNSPYQQAGRYQNEKQAKVLDQKIHDVLVDYCPKFHTVIANKNAIKKIITMVEKYKSTDIKKSKESGQKSVYIRKDKKIQLKNESTTRRRNSKGKSK
jgi:Zn-finger nucleic acid-binding protein